MKKIFVLVMFTCFGFIQVYSQFTKNSICIGGFGQLQFQKSQNVKTNHIRMEPSIGYLFFNQLLVGVGPVLEIENQKSDDGTVDSYTEKGISCFLEYYILRNRISPIVGFGFEYNLNHNEIQYISDGIKGGYEYNNEAAKLKPYIGVAYLLNESISLEAIIGYYFENYYSQVKDASQFIDSELDQNTLEFLVGLKFFL